MSLLIRADEPKTGVKRFILDGSLDANTAKQLEEELFSSLNQVTSPEIKAVIVDFEKLNYISSAGLKVIFRLRQIMDQKKGQTYAINVQPQIQKVFDIVKALPTESVFKSFDELDVYLDAIQRKIIDNS